MARLLMTALARANHRVELASRFRSREGVGDPDRQQALADLGQHLARRLIRQYQARPESERPDLWFTYHLYYKAPDWLGPPVADALDIPYVVAEASHAGKRAEEPWAIGHAGAATAIARADAIINLNPNDIAGLSDVASPKTLLVMLKPFLDGADFAAAANRRSDLRREVAQRFGLDGSHPWLLTVAMMRAGDKLASYRVLGAALAALRDCAWQLMVVGDGPARAEVEASLSGLGRGRVHYAGARLPEEMPQFYAPADLLVWPAINEAYGMTLLEAQAAGVPVVAGAAGGVPTIVAGERTGLLTPPGDAAALAAAVRALLGDPARRQRMGETAKELIAEDHDIGAAARILDGALHDAVNRHRRLH
jgi:glycosyltransferase involved in cell wall biosynthesis